MKGVDAPPGYSAALASDEPPFPPPEPEIRLPPTDDLLAELERITRAVNRAVTYSPDLPGRDRWGGPQRLDGALAGDCEDFCIEKLRRLLALGYPRGALAFAVVEIPGAPQRHALLEVLAGDDALCLDSCHDFVFPRSKVERAGTRWLARERAGAWEDCTAGPTLAAVLEGNPVMPDALDWTRWPNFSAGELACKCAACQAKGSRCEMDPAFMDRLQTLRNAFGPLPITSGFRCPGHNRAVSTTGNDGPHTTGRAVDVRVLGSQARLLIGAAIERGFTGIGVKQRGEPAGRFLHLDDLPEARGRPRPWLWSY